MKEEIEKLLCGNPKCDYFLVQKNYAQPWRCKCPDRAGSWEYNGDVMVFPLTREYNQRGTCKKHTARSEQ